MSGEDTAETADGPHGVDSSDSGDSLGTGDTTTPPTGPAGGSPTESVQMAEEGLFVGGQGDDEMVAAPSDASSGEDLRLSLRRQQDATLPDHYEVVESYWVNPPFAYALILRDTRRDDLEYRIIEPPLTEAERTLYQTLRHELKDRLLYRTEADADVDRTEQLEDNARRAITELGLDVEEGAIQRLFYYLRRDLINYGRVDPLMHDPLLEEISLNGPNVPVFVYHRDHEDLATNIAYHDEDRLDSFVTKVAQRSGTDISISDPIEGTSLPDGSRAQLSLNDEVTPRGSSVTIRKFREEPFSPVELVKYGTFSLEQMAYLWMLISNGYSGIIAGGTGSGKTTTLNAVSMFIPPKQKIVSIEDTREVQLPHDNWVQSLTREAYAGDSNAIDMGDLLKAALRQRPEYMVVGEVRGEEAYSMFQAMNTGHTTYSTMHADSVSTAISRLEHKPIGVERELIGELGFLSVQTVAFVDGQKVRRNNELVEVIGLDEERKLNYRTVFEWNEANDTIERATNSKHAEQLRNEGKNPEKMMRNRYNVLEYLLENDIVGYDPVTTVVSIYNTNSEIVLDMIENDELNLERLEELAKQFTISDGKSNPSADEGATDDESAVGDGSADGAVDDPSLTDQGVEAEAEGGYEEGVPDE